ncbi:MAG TPA: ABC transporter permease [Candidatus Acidoferrales bacterium]|nr:ABC transporter permease [Candidatus Acidoferrales bacterium]
MIAKATAAQESKPQGAVEFSREGDTLRLELAGSWTINAALPSLRSIEPKLQSTPPVRRLAFDTRRLSDWDSILLTSLLHLQEMCARLQIEIDQTGLPGGVQRLLALASAVPERAGVRRAEEDEPFLVRVGKLGLRAAAEIPVLLTFVGESAVAFAKLLRGRARFRRVEFFLLLQQCGAQALPIVSLISFLSGLILAFVGAAQLRQFGAEIYVANLVGLGMAREMGAMMTAVIMAGRTGAAFAAQLGTMTVNQEIEALRTTGLSPMEFLVMPRMLALALMIPLLTIYSDFIGMLGGGVVGVAAFDISLTQYYEQTRGALTLSDFWAGLIKGTVFGILVSLAGCLRGMQCGRDAAAVGQAATSAVVTAIVWIVVADAILTVLYDVLGI